jgi:predicted ribosomally synthesized peptide with SipW-like signal peptide
MKKILGLSVAALLIIAMVGGATWAFFQDTESSTGNRLTAGTLDLTLDNPVAGNMDIGGTDAYPGNADSAGYYTLTNIGTLDGVLSFTLTNAKNYESPGFTEFENDSTGTPNDTGTATGGSTTTVVDSGASWTPDAFIGMTVAVDGKGSAVITDNDATSLTVGTAFSSAVAASDDYHIGSGTGELAANASVRLWVSESNTGTFSDGNDTVLTLSGSTPGVSTSATTYASAYYAVADLESVEFDTSTLGFTLAEDDVLYFFVDWKIDNAGSAVNNFQGDKVEFDLEFVLTQEPNP